MARLDGRILSFQLKVPATAEMPFARLSQFERELIQASGLPGSNEAFSSDPVKARAGQEALANVVFSGERANGRPERKT